MLNSFTYDNNVIGTLSGPITGADTTLQVLWSSPNKPIPPTASPSRPAVLTLVDNMIQPTKIEIIYAHGVTLGHSTCIVTSALRGQEETAAEDWDIGAIVFQGLTRAMLNPSEVTLPTIKGLDSLEFEGGGRIYPVEGGAPGGLNTKSLSIENQLSVNGHSYLSGGVSILGGTSIAGGTPPANSSAPGSAGEIRWNSSYLFICVGSNNWKRVALSSF